MTTRSFKRGISDPGGAKRRFNLVFALVTRRPRQLVCQCAETRQDLPYELDLPCVGALKLVSALTRLAGYLAKFLIASLGSGVKNPDLSMEFGFADTTAVGLRQRGFRARCGGVVDVRRAEGKPLRFAPNISFNRSWAAIRIYGQTYSSSSGA